MRGSVLLGRANLALIVTLGFATLAFFVLAWGLLPFPPNDVDNVLNVAPPLALTVAVEILIITIRIVGFKNGSIEVVNVLTVRRLQIGQIQDVIADEGLEIILRSGERVRTAAYSQSLSGHIAKYPRSVVAAQRIKDFIDHWATCAAPEASVHDIAPRVRWRGIAAAIFVGATLFAGSLGLNAIYGA